MKEMIDPDARTVEDGRPDGEWCRLGHSSWGKYAPEVAEKHMLRGPGKMFRGLRRALHTFFEFTRGYRMWGFLLAHAAIVEEDLRMLVMTDEVEDVVRCVRECARRRFGMKIAASLAPQGTAS